MTKFKFFAVAVAFKFQFFHVLVFFTVFKMHRINKI